MCHVYSSYINCSIKNSEVVDTFINVLEEIQLMFNCLCDHSEGEVVMVYYR